MSRELKCDICDGTDYSELNTCHICRRNYCEICEGTIGPVNICELCITYNTDED